MAFSSPFVIALLVAEMIREARRGTVPSPDNRKEVDIILCSS